MQGPQYYLRLYLVQFIQLFKGKVTDYQNM